MKSTSRAAIIMKALALTLVAVVLPMAAACGRDNSSVSQGSPSPSQSTQLEPTDTQTPTLDVKTPPLASEDDLAESLLLTPADFPPGWIHEPDQPGEDPQEPSPNPLEACLDDEYAGQTGSAIGGEFSDTNTTRLSINPSVYIFDTPASAQNAAQTIISNAQCIADVVGEGIEVNGSFALGKTYTEPLSAEAFGATRAIRLFETLISLDNDPPDSDVLVFDVVILVRERVLYEIDGFQRHSPIDQSLLMLYVDRARDKIPEGA